MFLIIGHLLRGPQFWGVWVWLGRGSYKTRATLEENNGSVEMYESLKGDWRLPLPQCQYIQYIHAHIY
jgi:hypothetical protein